MQTMQMVPPDDQILIQSKLGHLFAKFATNASVAMLLLNLIQVTESISGSVVPLAMFFFSWAQCITRNVLVLSNYKVATLTNSITSVAAEVMLAVFSVENLTGVVVLLPGPGALPA